MRMDDFLQMDIFFFVTTFVVVVLGVLVALLLYKVFRILSHVEEISKQLSEESALIRADIAAARTSIRDEGFKLKHLSAFFRSTLGRFVPRKKKRGE